MKVKDILENSNIRYDTYEVYKYTGKRHSLHSDFIDNIDELYSLEYYKDATVEDYEVMDEERYDETIMANVSEHADFGMWYDNKNAKVLVIALSDKWTPEGM